MKLHANKNGIAKMLGNRIAPPWCIGADQEVIVNEGNGLKKITLNSMIDREKKQIESDLSTQNVPKKYAAEKAKLQKEYEEKRILWVKACKNQVIDEEEEQEKEDDE